MKLLWATGDNGCVGNAWGYTRAIRSLYHNAQAVGVEMAADADVVMHFIYPVVFKPVPGKVNVLFTMWENDYPPAFLIDALNRADAVLTPSTYCTELFRRHTMKPVSTVPLGVDIDHFVGVARPRPRNRPFRWLWIGAHNPRKGYEEVCRAWDHSLAGSTFAARPDCELYLKTTRQDEGDGYVTRVGNVIRDTRRVTDLELLKLYAAADGFVFPSQGEGFGLTLAEAMATALPCVATVVAGVMDFADATTCRPAAWKLAPQRMKALPTDPWRDIMVPRPDVADVAEQMQWVMDHWTQARRMGVRAHRRMQRFTWRAAGERLRDVLCELHNNTERRTANG